MAFDENPLSFGSGNGLGAGFLHPFHNGTRQHGSGGPHNQNNGFGQNSTGGQGATNRKSGSKYRRGKNIAANQQTPRPNQFQGPAQQPGSPHRGRGRNLPRNNRQQRPPMPFGNSGLSTGRRGRKAHNGHRFRDIVMRDAPALIQASVDEPRDVEMTEAPPLLEPIEYLARGALAIQDLATSMLSLALSGEAGSITPEVEMTDAPFFFFY
ncbi:hypothetical protein ASPWEDRAFT_67786 [Aspergillus wentii DTO 134E9]|uniref:Uncharacterized protein n=1 Tax=Aspergillus wentii DTO 134E9 TaxID=1073089 RepID=A0A1L9RRJ2_ASPWE|nr:uncharacterized protein ASPWEDRAFT_67786 [Aspergillus wentii DTO 134E9]KAI9930426.1 hypothetical protein MW887_011180 [Aspergillus wentii]OJJ37586.1 hypothetical protein ASPWEDRAFT_67786 [Aspergillus wentii DTO 134E9]